MTLLVVGGILNSALYLAACVLAGLMLDRPIAWQLGIAALGVTYLSYLAQATDVPRAVAVVFVGLSIMLGVGSGLALLWAR